MLNQVIFLCCSIIVILAGVPKLDKVKDCRAIEGRCVNAAYCPDQYILKPGCPIGRGGQAKTCCATRKQRRLNVMKKRKSKGCKQKHRCRKAGGRCIANDQPCLGTMKDGACKKDNCQCCILKDGDKTETKLRGHKSRKNPRKGNKKECKKKKKCKGFCVGKNEECRGELDPSGCKGKKCSCCTLGDQKNGQESGVGSSDTIQNPVGEYEYNYYGPDYYDYYNQYNTEQCYDKNVNGSCNQGCFTCHDGQCQPSYYQCDKYNDCEDGSDELGCPPSPKFAPGSCPREYKWVLRSCYKVVAQPSSWSNARTVCQAVNGDLALIYDHKLFTAYFKAFHEIEKAVYWVGIYRENGTYTWVNSTLLPDNSTLWGTKKDPALGNTGEDCVVLNFSENHLQPTNCEVDTYNNKSIYSICEYLDSDYYGDYYGDYHK